MDAIFESLQRKTIVNGWGYDFTEQSTRGSSQGRFGMTNGLILVTLVHVALWLVAVVLSALVDIHATKTTDNVNLPDSTETLGIFSFALQLGGVVLVLFTAARIFPEEYNGGNFYMSIFNNLTTSILILSTVGAYHMWQRFHFEDGPSDYWQRMSTASFFASFVAIIFYCLSAMQLKHKNLMILTGFAMASGFQIVSFVELKEGNFECDTVVNQTQGEGKCSDGQETLGLVSMIMTLVLTAVWIFYPNDIKDLNNGSTWVQPFIHAILALEVVMAISRYHTLAGNTYVLEQSDWAATVAAFIALFLTAIAMLPDENKTELNKAAQGLLPYKMGSGKPP
jgi:hypothetical protein